MSQHVKQHPAILCFRAFDMRDRFPEPVETFEEALVLLQSDRAYLPEMISDIVCYLRSGKSLTIPHEFYLQKKKVFSAIEDASRWVHERDTDSGFSLSTGIANPELPIDEQIQEAWAATETCVVPSSDNEHVITRVNKWLNTEIHSLMMEALELINRETLESTNDNASHDHNAAAQVKPSDADEKCLAKSNAHPTMEVSTPTDADHGESVHVDDDTIAWFKARFDDQKNPKRWVITSRDCVLTDITGNAYFDVVNHLWVSRISDATCIKDKAIAEAIVASFGEERYADVIEHFVSQKELAKAAIKLESDPAVIYYHSKTDTYLYEERNRFSDYPSHALIALSNPDQFTLLKRSPGETQLFVSIPDCAMDELALAWCKHRHLVADASVSDD
jgi:hypothetical protein